MTLTFTAYNGFTLPVVGFGTYRLNGSQGFEVTSRAIATGYTLLDSAFNYENEGTVGRAVRFSSAPRSDIIVTSKLPGRHHDYDEALTTIEESAFRMGLDYLDLYLIHWPNPRQDRYVEAWTALIEAQKKGLVRQIGVSNFLPVHIKRLEEETGVLPVVNQIELHPYFPQTEAIAYHKNKGILTEAWSPLGRGNDLLTNPIITEIAAKHSADPGQVVLSWTIARGAIPLPKAASPERQRVNLNAPSLALNPIEIEAITALGRPDGRTHDQDPAVYEEF